VKLIEHKFLKQARYKMQYSVYGLRLTRQMILFVSAAASAACSSGDVPIASNDAAIARNDAYSESGADASSSGSSQPDGDAESGASSSSAVPACTVTADQATVLGGIACYPSSAMPSGTCSGMSSCSFCSILCGPSGPRQSYDCTCSNGTWMCSLAWQDTVLCPQATDASADADASGDGG
jgi:hypothetical protein